MKKWKCCWLQAKHNVVEKIGQLFPSRSEELVVVAIKLLFNLSFDTSLRSRMIAAGLLDHIAPLLGWFCALSLFSTRLLQKCQPCVSPH